MPDLNSRVRFTGDASQLLATYKAIGAQAAALQAQLNRINNASIKARGLTPASSALSQDKNFEGPVVRKLSTEVDGLNRTFRTLNQTAIYTKRYGDLVTGSFEEVRGNLDQLLPAMTQYNRVANQRTRLSENAKRDAAAIRGVTSAQIDAARQARAIGRLQDPRPGRRGQFTSDLAGVIQYYRDIGNAALRALPSVQALQDHLTARRVASRPVADALAAEPPIPASVQQLRNISPSILRQLQRQGLGLDASTLYKQNASFDFEKDLIRQTTRISGGFTDLATGIRQNVSIELDKAGKQITRFGGHLSGLQNFLNQTVRNFQKVVQWGIATTAVFGGLAFAARELSVLSELNTNLNRLSITANLTQEETNKLFKSLSQIAITTATPLTEITASADDIALAVRDASATTEGYLRDITNLTEAVGIYTNLTGTDTVEATDLLVSSMKQLGLQTEDVTSLLSKITAVAGGQSAAIKDITEGLAAMAEAARNAGLSVDRTIATVQILSQVTAKSPSEIATAFKNLVGALENPAGIKQLKALNIELISQGNNIIDIYTELAEKLRTGEIASTEISGVLRNLAGGPRRAPDAAALLSNIDKIAAQEARAFRATNEALIANAKILDTVQAKITQLQAKFDAVVFEKFGKAFEQLAVGLVDGLTALLELFNDLDTSVIAGAVQLGAFIIGLRLLVGLGRGVTGILGSMVQGVRELAVSFNTAAGAAANLNKQQQQLTLFGSTGGAGRFSRFRGAAGGIGAGALLGGAAGAAFGGGPGQIIGGALSGAGLSALTAPVPLPWLKLGGAIAFAAGTLLTFVDNSEDAAEASEKSARAAQEQLAVYARYKDTQQTIEDLRVQQDNLRQTIATLNEEENKTPETFAQIRDAQAQYIDNTVEMTNATVSLQKTMTELTNVAPELAAAIRGVMTGSIRPEELESQITALQEIILRQTNPDAVVQRSLLPGPGARITPFNTNGREGTLAEIRKTINELTLGEGGEGPTLTKDITELFDLVALRENAEAVKGLFSEMGTELTATFEPTGKNIALISAAIKTLKESGDDLAPTLEKTFGLFVQQNSVLDNAVKAFEIYQARIDALSVFDPAKAATLQKLADISLAGITAAGENNDVFGAAKIQEQFEKILNGDLLARGSNLIPILEEYAKQTGLLGDEALETATFMEVLAQVAEKFGFNLSEMGVIVPQQVTNFEEMAEAVAKAREEMQGFADTLTEDLAQKSADLQAGFQSGDIKKADFTAQIAQIDAMIAGVEELSAMYDGLSDAVISQLDPSIQDLAVSLTDINGLQDAQTLTTQELIERMFSLADTYGLTGDEVVKLTDKMANMIRIAKRIAETRANLKISATMDVSQALKAYRAMRVAATNMARLTGGPASFTGFASMDAAIRELESLQADINSFTAGGGGGFDDIFRGSDRRNINPSKRTSGTTTRRASNPPDVSTLDLPEEIANAYNRDELIKEAIRRAKRLQSQIPGATKEGKNDIVELLKGTQRILEVRGVKDDLLRKALEELAEIEKKRLEFETKADTIRRIRVGGGDFAAIANVPVNSRTGVSVGGANGPINVSLNLNGTVLTPAQFSQFADLVAAAIKRQISA